MRPASGHKRICHSPSVLDVLIEAAGYEHGEKGVVPGADEHEGEAQAHAEERQGPGGHTAQTLAGMAPKQSLSGCLTKVTFPFVKILYTRKSALYPVTPKSKKAPRGPIPTPTQLSCS
jgi:hypothetical protein